MGGGRSSKPIPRTSPRASMCDGRRTLRSSTARSSSSGSTSSAGFDTEATFIQSHDEMFREGYAYVGVSAQKRGVDQLRSSNPGRYGPLNHPGDNYSYDIFTQAALALRGHKGVDPLEGLKPRRLIAAGESQSAARMVSYIDAINPLVHAFDGFFVFSRLAGASSLNSGVTMPPAPIIRTDGPEPILDLQTEGDLVVLRSHTAHQPDSSRFRLWEVAGGSHADEHTLSRTSPPAPSTPGSLCTERLNSNRTYLVVEAGIRALRRWVQGRDAAAPRPSARDRRPERRRPTRARQLRDRSRRHQASAARCADGDRRRHRQPADAELPGALPAVLPVVRPYPAIHRRAARSALPQPSELRRPVRRGNRQAPASRVHPRPRRHGS